MATAPREELLKFFEGPNWCGIAEAVAKSGNKEAIDHLEGLKREVTDYLSAMAEDAVDDVNKDVQVKVAKMDKEIGKTLAKNDGRFKEQIRLRLSQLMAEKRKKLASDCKAEQETATD